MKKILSTVIALIFLQGCATQGYKPLDREKVTRYKDADLIIALTEAPLLMHRDGIDAGAVAAVVIVGGLFGGIIAASITETAAAKKGAPFQALVTDPTPKMARDLAQILSNEYGLPYENTSPITIVSRNTGIDTTIDTPKKIPGNHLLLQVSNNAWDIVNGRAYLAMSRTYVPYENMTKEELKLAKEKESKAVLVYNTTASLYKLSNGEKTILGKGHCSNTVNHTGNHHSIESLSADNASLLQQELDEAAQLCTKCYQKHLFGLPIVLKDDETCNLTHPTPETDKSATSLGYY